MDIVTTSLEALIQKATNPLNEKPDIAAIEAFCVMLGKESKGVHVASRLLATHIQSTSEKEALQALTLLDTCMKRCGRTFHIEVGKFRFLNVMIKLVSPKYLGNKTPEVVRHKILDLLHAWTKDYPREVKIKETYEMLKKQGVIKEQVSPKSSIECDAAKLAKPKNPIFEDEEKTKLLQELLQSKDPFDLKLANKLIKSMVKDDERRAQLNSQRNMDLESVHNNVKLLSEMLDSYVPDKSSTEDVELMKELYDACERLKPTVTRLGNESQGNDELRKYLFKKLRWLEYNVVDRRYFDIASLRMTIVIELVNEKKREIHRRRIHQGEVIAAHDELTQVLEKYASVLVLGGGTTRGGSTINRNTPSSLLDFSSPTDIINAPCTDFNKKNSELPLEKPKSDMDMLGDIFNSLGNSLEASSSTPDTTLLLPDTNIMQPISIVPSIAKPIKAADATVAIVKMDSKAKALEDLNQLGESLLKESLSQNNSIARSSFNNISKPLKDIVACDSSATSLMNVSQPLRNATFLVSETGRNLQSKNIATANGLDEQLSKITIADNNKDLADFGDLLNDDDAMLDASSLPSQIGNDQLDTNQKNSGAEEIVSTASTFADVEIKPLTNINVTIDNIKPGTIRPLTVIEEKNGITVVLHFPKGSPREDVTVIVVTTMSKNSKALSNYLFQAVVPKNCKCRLQSPSGTELPGHNPFLPPSAITQIMLIANPQKDPLSLKFMLSYTMDDETFTEMGEVDRLPTA